MATAQTTWQMQTLTTEQQAHAIALAEAAHLTHTAHLEAAPEMMDAESFTVPTRDRHGVHVVITLREQIACDCTAGQHSRPCCHIGAVLHYQAQRARAMARQDDTMATFAENLGW